MNFKHIFLIGCTLGIVIIAHANNGMVTAASLTGKITDKFTGEPVPGAIVYIPDLKTGTSSNLDGVYNLRNLPRRKMLVQVTLVGYKMIALIIDLSVTETADFVLEESINELHEVVITGLATAAEHNRTPTPIAVIPTIELVRSASTNIIDAVAKQPGISQMTTGSGISKPVIRGLGFNRVVTVVDGIRQEGQQWGDEHGIETDAYAVDKVEIVKGPASLSYGSDAMAGVINLLSAPTLPDGVVRGNLQANYQSNNGLIGSSVNLAGNSNGFIWDVRYSKKQAHAYTNRYDGFVLNSGFKENAIRGIAGVNKSWGYAHLHLSAYRMTPGIVEGERDSATGKFIKFIALSDTMVSAVLATKNDFSSYIPLVPYQNIHHYKAVLNSSIIVGKGTVKATLGWQQNDRKEFADVFDSGKFGLAFLLNTVNYDARYLFADRNYFTLAAGVNGMHQSSANIGSEFLIPDYDLFDIGLYTIAKKTINKLDISAGVRYDSRKESGEDLYLNSDGEVVSPAHPDAFQQFKAFKENYTGLSGTLGATYQFSTALYTKLNVARGFRAPNIAEISANGVHEGSINYIIGVPGLKSEHSLQFDVALGFQTNHVNGAMDFFHNHIDNFIFLTKLESEFGGDSLRDGFSTFKYVSGSANIAGGEVSLDIHPHPLDWLHIENSFSYVIAKQHHQPDSTKNLPFTPPVKWSSEIQATVDNVSKIIGNAYLTVGVDAFMKQDNIYSAYNTETSTPGYVLLNLAAGFDFVRRNVTLFSVYMNATNITDVAYQSHLSRLKYAPVNQATGRSGVYNMGRNFSVKVIVPFNLKG